MKKKLKFNITLDEFPRVMGEKINFVRRDQEKFDSYGYTTDKVDVLEGRLTNFEDFQTDEEFIGDVMIATEKKNTGSEEIQGEVRKIMLRVQNKYGVRSAYYKKFGASGLAGMTDARLLKSARRVARVATLYLGDLTESGLDTAQIDQLKVLADQFDNAMDVQEDAIADREIGTLLRINTANEIYTEVAKLCETGKEIWRKENEAKYNDYIIYDTPTGKPEAEEVESSDESSDSPLA